MSENEQIVRRLIDAFNRGDVEGVVAAFAEDCELDEPPEMPDGPRGYRGRDGIREWMSNLRETAAVRFEPRSFRFSGDLVVSEWAASGRGRASEVPFEWTSFVVLRIRDGEVVRAQAFLSAKEALDAAGLSG